MIKRCLLAIPKHEHSIECVIYDTLEAMWAALDRGNGFYGYYQSLFRDDERPLIMGRICLVRGHYGGGVVAHELLHAVLDAGFALHSETDNDDELHVYDIEALCDMIGNLTAQFWRWHFRLETELAITEERGKEAR